MRDAMAAVRWMLRACEIFVGTPGKRVLAGAVLAALVAAPASGQLQYFGYVTAGDDDSALRQVKAFTNFAQLSAGDNLTDPWLRTRVAAMAAVGVKAVIDLGKVLWCDYGNDGSYSSICFDWQSRWSTWKSFNASILTPDKVIALSIRDEPFNWNVDMYDFEQAAARVKADLPWVKTYMTEAGCVVARDDCGIHPFSGALNHYYGTLPNIDWIGVQVYGVWPKTDATFGDARAIFKARFPGKKWIYVLDGYWDPGLHPQRLYDESALRQVASDWYDLAHADADAVLLGVVAWYGGGAVKGSQNLSCYVLTEHVLIGQAITGKTHTQTALPIGGLDTVPNGDGLATGWSCYPDGILCENPPLDLYVNGSLYFAPPTYTTQIAWRPECGNGAAYKFERRMTVTTSGYPITVRANRPGSPSVTLPSACAESPACIWYSTIYDPKGYMEVLGTNAVAAGWVCDPDAPQVSSKVRLVLEDGTPLGTFTTNLASEQAVADECRGGYLHRFSVQLPSWSGCHRVYAYARDLANANFEKQIPWLCAEGWYCPLCR